MSMRFFQLFVLVALIVGIPGAGHAREIHWVGCGITKNAFMTELAAAFSKATGHAVILGGGGATKGIRAVAANTADIGGTCRPQLKGKDGAIHAEEKEAQLIQVAWDALAVVVHFSNPVDDISLEKLKKIFMGEISSWKDIPSGENLPIALVEREGKESGVGYVFRKLVFHDANLDFPASSLSQKSSTSVEKKLEKLPHGMAVDGVSSARRNKELKILAVDGVAPSKENISSGKYPFFRPLYLVLPAQPSLEAKALVDFALSAEGQKVIADQGTVNLEEGKALVPLWQEQVKKLGM